MTWEKKSGFQQNHTDPSIPSLNQNLMNQNQNHMMMEQYKSLTTQPILSRRSMTWEKSKFQQNHSIPSLTQNLMTM